MSVHDPSREARALGDGWFSAERPRDGRFADQFVGIAVKPEGDSRARVRMPIGEGQANIGGSVHGGFLMAFADQSLFVAPYACGRWPGWGVTLSLSMSFIGSGVVGTADAPQMIEAVVDITGETGRMMFLRGLIEQDGRAIASFDASLRKFEQRSAR